MKGVVCPLLTPFNNDLGFNGELYLQHAQWLLERGMHFISPFGTTGEALSMSVRERINAVDCLVDGGVDPSRIMPGAGLCNFPETLELVRHALDRHCAAVMLLPPFFYKNAGDEGLYAYFSGLIEALGSPRLRICLYHIPPMAGMGFSPGLANRLASAFPGTVVAYKDSSGDFDNTMAIRASAPDLSVFPGSETFLKPGVENGCAGCISATCNVNPEAIRGVYDMLIGEAAGDAEAANAEMTGFRRRIESYAPIPDMKGMLAVRRDEPRWRNVRPPLLPATGDQTRSLLRELGVG
ncbi:MAG: dihydrodipicolinate synthase family protein [Gammaproteobacteria bacterium]|nr:dihydrodipicolinate synthase family protein [Gammaproteobacteria bacterium]MYD76082.1 dihydrodipicolinate synthase family protein [Gammaproteobacteria bacterium]MYJ52173.1 dihydrodipicolinate synthase family protein [Gammaproteobacteria bacterium]